MYEFGTWLDTPVNHYALPGLKARPHLIRLVEPHQGNRPSGITGSYLQDSFCTATVARPEAVAPRHSTLAHCRDLYNRRCAFTRVQCFQRRHGTPVFVAKRQVIEEILDREKAMPSQLSSTGWADPLEGPERDSRLHSAHVRSHLGRHGIRCAIRAWTCTVGRSR